MIGRQYVSCGCVMCVWVHVVCMCVYVWYLCVFPPESLGLDSGQLKPLVVQCS